ncbi:calcium-dependent protein kinase 27-like [Hordeum vulgare]|nr:calcium-dependent protein kinase 27-like [Hordeum vulgare]
MRCMERYELVCRDRAWRQQDICKLESLHASVRCLERAELHTDEGPNVFQVRSRIQLSQDDVVAIFFSFDEAGKGYIAPWDLKKMANINDFIWTDFELSKMIHCFDSDKDGKASAPHHQHLRLKYSCQCTLRLDTMIVPSKGSSEETGLGSWSKSNEDASMQLMFV